MNDARLAGDPSIACLDDAERAQLAAIWRGRARSEASVGSVFAQLIRELTAGGAPADIIALAEHARADEERHARVCAELSAAYSGEPVVLEPAPRVRLPDHDEPSVRLRAALHAVNLCCIGETIATAFVDACLAACSSPALREIHGQHLSDEVRHARVGWAYLATLTADERAALAPSIPRLLAVQLALWTQRIGELPEAGIPGHGYPARAVMLEAVRDAVRELVLPGFDHVRVDSAPARRWFSEHGGAASRLDADS